MNQAQRISIIVLALFWSTVGSVFLFAAFANLILSIKEQFLLIWVILALIIGSSKGYFVLWKVSARMIADVYILKDTVQNRFFGWAKVLHIRGFVLLGLMIGLGILLSHVLSEVDPIYRSFIRLIIGSALLTGSIKFWKEVKLEHSK